MERSTKTAWMESAGDLREADVEDVPVKGQSVRVRGLAAGYASQAQSEALEMKSLPNGEQVATVNVAKIEVLQFTHGCVDPTFTKDEAVHVSRKFGPAFRKIIEKIDELSGTNKEALEAAAAQFPVRGGGQDAESGAVAAGAGGGPKSAGGAVPVGNGGPDIPVRTGS